MNRHEKRPFLLILLPLLLLGGGLLLFDLLAPRAPERVRARAALHPTPPPEGDGAVPTRPALTGGTACTNGLANNYPCTSVDLMAHLPLATFGATSASDVWGWSDPESGRDFALFGVNTGVAFVEITNPAMPRYLGQLPSHSGANLWHDVKVYDHYALVVSEAGNHGMQLFDLHELLEVDVEAEDLPLTFAAAAHYDGFGSAHNLAVNQESGFAYAVDAEQGRHCGGGLHMIDVRAPRAPRFAGCYDGGGTVHDAQCVIYHGPDADYQGRELCFNSSKNDFTIVDVTDKAQPVEVARRRYRGLAYAHQGWLTEDHAYFLLNDEFDEINYGTNTRIYTWALADLDRPAMTGIHSGPTKATSHNLYVRDGYVYAAHYTRGMRIYRIGDLERGELEAVAHFDTYIPGNQPTYQQGAWTACPCFDEPGKVVVSTIYQGLFILHPHLPAAAPPSSSSDS